MLLYQLIEEHWPTFLERAEQSGGLPDFIVEEFEAYLRCGMLEHDLGHLACRQCGESLAVAYLRHREPHRAAAGVVLVPQPLVALVGLCPLPPLPLSSAVAAQNMTCSLRTTVAS